MSPFDYMLLGALALAALYCLFLAIRKTWLVATSMDEALRTVPPILKALQDLVDAARGLQKEFQIMRHIATGDQPTPNFGVEATPGAGTEQPEIPQYPKPPFEMYPIQTVVPDAKPEDTQVFAPTDAEVAEEEKLENLIDAGLAYREEVQPPGREVESQ